MRGTNTVATEEQNVIHQEYSTARIKTCVTNKAAVVTCAVAHSGNEQVFTTARHEITPESMASEPY